MSNTSINPWLAKKISELGLNSISNKVLHILVEVRPDKLEYVVSKLESMGVVVRKELISFGMFIPVEAPSNLIPAIASIEGVVMVHYDMPVWIKQFPSRSFKDPLLGVISVSEVEIPGIPILNVLGPLTAPLSTIRSDVKLIPTSESRKLIEAPEDNMIRIKVAVLDTGGPFPLHPQVIGRKVVQESLVPGEPLPYDGQGHGCLSGKTFVYTSCCGLSTLEEVWSKVPSTPNPISDGEFKPFPVKVYTIGMSGIVEVGGVFRKRVNRKVIVDTTIGSVESTTWHRFLVIIPGNDGYEVVERRADELNVGDALLTSYFIGFYDSVKLGYAIDYFEDVELIPAYVTDVRVVDTDEHFYDLANSDDGTYYANGLIVHNSWCHTSAFLGSSKTMFGTCKGVADAYESYHGKVLSNAGFGSTSSIIKGMERAAAFGAKVISMSLGGEQQGPVDSDPNCKVIKMLSDRGVVVVVAAGNEGSDEWTICSPGVCVDSVTVGSYSITDKAPAYWSSRGPSGKWYKEHRDDWVRDYSRYGDDIVKPDILAPGGGRATKGSKPDELLYSGSHGWFDGFYDLIPNMFEGMHGTSMATPHAAGLIALLIDRGIISSASDVKRVMSSVWGRSKDIAWGYGLIKWSYFSRL